MLNFLASSKRFFTNKKNFYFSTDISSFSSKKENLNFEKFNAPYFIDKQSDYKVQNDIKKLLQKYNNKEGVKLITEIQNGSDFDDDKNKDLDIKNNGALTLGIIILFTGLGIVFFRRTIFIKK